MRPYGPYYVAVRKSIDGPEWIDIHTMTGFRDDVHLKAKETGRFCSPIWENDNPVVRIAKVYITEEVHHE